MNDKFLLLLAFDSLLGDLDKDFEGVPKEVNRMIESKVYESYGLEVTSKKENIEFINKSIIQDVKNYRDKLIKEILDSN